MITRVGDERLVVSSRRARQTFHRGNTRLYELVVARGLKPHLDGRSRKITVTVSMVTSHGGSPPLRSRALARSRWNLPVPSRHPRYLGGISTPGAVVAVG